MTKTPFLQNSTVKCRLNKVTQVKRALQSVFDREMRKLDNEMADIRARCGHTNVEIQRDHMGGCESECAVCHFTSRFPIVADPVRAKEVMAKQSAPRIQ